MATKKIIYDSDEFDWSDECGGGIDLKLLEPHRKEPPKRFFIRDIDNPEFELPLALERAEMEPENSNLVCAWHYTTPYATGYEDYEGAEVTIYNS
jgi:hypothetical protein